MRFQVFPAAIIKNKSRLSQSVVIQTTVRKRAFRVKLSNTFKAKPHYLRTLSS